LGPGDLARALCGLELSPHPNLLIGLQKADDAGVYRLSDDQALIQTVDFFTPIVDDPVLFGRIAVANALSDVYAMGGKPVCAMNVVGFPVDKLPIELLQACLKGGLEKLTEAGVALAGGHSVDNPEFLFGLAVSGLVHPERILAKQGVQDGDALVLTKPLGTGIVSTAQKASAASAEAEALVIASMEALNRTAAEALAPFEVHACTDVTGFGLVGHAAEMIEGCPVGLEIRCADLPIFEPALEYARMGLMPGGLHRNRRHRQDMLDVVAELDPALVDLAFDPQTSGGLLVALPADQAEAYLDALIAAGVESAALIGRASAELAGRIRLA